MIKEIDKAIKSLAERSFNPENQDEIMKLTQSISNLAHAKLSLLSYEQEKDKNYK